MRLNPIDCLNNIFNLQYERQQRNDTVKIFYTLQERKGSDTEKLRYLYVPIMTENFYVFAAHPQNPVKGTAESINIPFPMASSTLNRCCEKVFIF